MSRITTQRLENLENLLGASDPSRHMLALAARLDDDASRRELEALVAQRAGGGRLWEACSALLDGYASVSALSPAEKAALDAID
jgi:hypothetical protein